MLQPRLQTKGQPREYQPWPLDQRTIWVKPKLFNRRATGVLSFIEQKHASILSYVVRNDPKHASRIPEHCYT